MPPPSPEEFQLKHVVPSKVSRLCEMRIPAVCSWSEVFRRMVLCALPGVDYPWLKGFK